ncbi:hypothetical protein [Enterobacter ludwigii]|uniref:hypothetical protein n=1 Tax=Enterobacter ludwigii TaxID=299767 RepID=UPI00273D02CD|nr:hypothetical protein [Enterobacter ludwigii]EKQ6529149.1 hypothetical protein [Klebsiella aerogenes]MDP5163425.1 hypothetical protein [Enterobacter ludwigii]
MKRDIGIVILLLSLSLPAGMLLNFMTSPEYDIPSRAVKDSNTQKEAKDTAQFESMERESIAQPDAWKAYQQVSDAVPDDAPTELQHRYRSLAVSLALKAAMACTPEALRLIERNDVIEFSVLRSSLVSSCRTAK